VLLVLAACSEDPGVRKQRHLQRGLQYLAAGKHNEAVIELKNALQIDPALVPALHALGRAYRQKSWHGDAIRELGRAVDLAPELVDARLELAKAFLALEAWRSAREHGEALLEKVPGSPYGHDVVGAALSGQGRSEEAIRTLTAGLKLAPTDADILQAYGEAQARAGRPDEAEKAYRAALAQNPKHIDALVGLGRLSLRHGKRDVASGLLSQARARAPENPKARLAMSELLIAEGKLDEAVRELEAVASQAWSARFELALADVYVKGRRYDSAMAILGPFVRRFPDATAVRNVLGAAALSGQRPELALAEFQEVVKREPDNLLGRYGLAAALVQVGRPGEGLTEFQRLAKPMRRVADYHLRVAQTLLALNRLDDAVKAAREAQRWAPARPEPYELLGRIHVTRNDFGRAQEMYAKALELAPGLVGAHVGLGVLYDLQKKPDEALKEFEAALRSDPRDRRAIDAKLAALVRQNRLAEAIAFVEAAAQRSPQDPSLLTTLGSLYLSNSAPRKAETQYRRAVSVDEGYPPARFNLARLAFREKKESDAAEHLQMILRKQPGHVPAALVLSGLYARQARTDQMIPVLEAAIERNPNLPELALPLADAYLKKGRVDEAVTRLASVVGANPGLFQARALLGIAHLKKGNPAEAVKQFEHANRLNPRVATNHYYLGQALAARGDGSGARKAYEQALQIDAGLGEARMALASLSGRNRDERAQGRQTPAPQIQELETAVRKDPGDVQARYALARAYLFNRQRKEAEGEFTRVLAINPTFPPANMAMALLRAQGGRPDDAAEYLRAALRAEPDNVAANALLAANPEVRGKWAVAIPHLEIAARGAPERYDIKLRLATLYGQADRLADGITVARELVAGRPRLAGGHYVLGDLLLRAGSVPEAIEALSTAVRLDPNHGPAHVTLGSAYERRGDVDKAIAVYKRAQTLLPADPRPPNNAAWLYASRGRDLDEALSLARKAQELVTRNPSFATLRPGILDTLGFVHYRRGEYAQAEPLFRQAADLATNDVVVQYHLGLTYHRLGRDNEAATWLRRSLQGGGKFAEADQARKLLAELGG
jgi:tetratricopeptide (TPR) repeat protein